MSGPGRSSSFSIRRHWSHDDLKLGPDRPCSPRRKSNRPRSVINDGASLSDVLATAYTGRPKNLTFTPTSCPLPNARRGFAPRVRRESETPRRSPGSAGSGAETERSTNGCAIFARR